MYFWSYLYCNALSLLTYIFFSHCVWPPQLSHKFICIKTNLNDVVQKSKGRGQREGGNKECDKAKLDNWEKKNKNKIHNFFDSFWREQQIVDELCELPTP